MPELKLGPALRDFESRIDLSSNERAVILAQSRPCSDPAHARLIFGHYVTAIQEAMLDGHPYIGVALVRLAYIFARVNESALPPSCLERTLDLSRALEYVLSHVDQHPESKAQAQRENKIHRLLVGSHGRLLTQPDHVGRGELPVIFQRVRFNESTETGV